MEVARKSASGQRLSWRSDEEAETLGSSSQDTVGCIYPERSQKQAEWTSGPWAAFKGKVWQ